MGNVDVRPAEPADLTRVQAVAETVWRATYVGHIPEADITAFLHLNYSVDALSFSRERLGPGLLVAELDELICGYAQAGRNRAGACELFAIYVLPKAQGQGAGFALWKAALAHVRGLGCPELELWVLAENERARRFYERQGARQAGTRRYPIGVTSINEVRYAATL